MDTSQDAGPSSPSKGKGSDTSRKYWQANWWDFYPILERPGRPIQWSQSSVIFTAHPTQPLITGRHFSSSKQFVLQSPTPIIASSASYHPPSVISVSPSDEWLFAFFPRRDGEGTGCIWKRGAQIDSWQPKEFWSFPKSGGVVTASWLANPREWVSGLSGIPTRLPSQGPTAPVSNPTLVLVTQDHNIHINYYRYVSPGLKTLKRCLSIPGMTMEAVQTSVEENTSATRQCVDATIGIGYNDSSIFIATHSRRMPVPTVPTPPLSNAPFNSMDLSVPVDLINSSERKPIDWETWGEERNVEIFEASLRFDGTAMGLAVHSISTLDIGKSSLARLAFLSAPPPLSLTPAGEHQSRTRNSVEKGNMYFTTTTVDFHEYVSPPTSNLTLYSFVAKVVPNRGPVWNLNRETTRAVENGIIAHTAVFVELSVPSNAMIYAYVLHNSVPADLGEPRAEELPIGSFKVLKIPDLTDAIEFNPVVINRPSGSPARDLPLFAAISPNHRLICTLSSSLWSSQISIHSLPTMNPSELAVPPASSALAIAILGRKSTEDIIHCIASPKMQLSEAAHIMYHALHILEKFKADLQYGSTWDIMGVATEVYKMRANLSKNDEETAMLSDRWQAAHDVCSLAACNIAFEDCKDEDGYDLEAVWQIIGMCTWVVSFMEKLMKSCVLSSNASNVKNEDKTDLSGVISVSIFLHLVHPFTLQNLIAALKHVKAVRLYLGTLPAGGENSQLAQTALIDTVDCSGIDFGGLIALLEEKLPAVQKIDGEECQRSITSCHPLPAMQPILVQLIQDISDSETILNKATLFIKPFDLVDGVAGLSIGPRKNGEIDVITKGLLLTQSSKDQCLRCGGRTAGSKNVSKVIGLVAPRWLMWERMWQVRCICGGPWLSVSVR